MYIVQVSEHVHEGQLPRRPGLPLHVSWRKFSSYTLFIAILLFGLWNKKSFFNYD